MITADELRARILSRIESLGITRHHAAQLAGLPDQTARDYLSGDHDLSADRVLRLAAAVGLRVDVRPKKNFAAPAPNRRGRPRKD